MKTRRDVFQAVADPTRRAILALLASQVMTGPAIAENFDSKRQTIARHVEILTECGLLIQKQTGREIYYHFNPQKMKEIAIWLEPYSRMWDERLDAMDDLLNEMQAKKVKRKK